MSQLKTNQINKMINNIFQIRFKLINLLSEFKLFTRAKKTNVGIIMVEQNAKQALQISHRGYVLVDGSNRYTGTGQDLSSDPDVARMFLGSRG